MKRIETYLFLLLILVFSGCAKDGNEPHTGTVTINNTIYPSGNNYYAIGFSFDSEKKINTVDSPGPDVVVLPPPAVPAIDSVWFDSPNVTESFYMEGEYGSAGEAISAYNDLTEVGILSWKNLAENIAPNQVWLFRTREGNFAKFRIVDVVTKMNSNAFVEVTFQWRVQPDGTIFFPSE